MIFHISTLRLSELMKEKGDFLVATAKNHPMPNSQWPVALLGKGTDLLKMSELLREAENNINVSPMAQLTEEELRRYGVLMEDL